MSDAKPLQRQAKPLAGNKRALIYDTTAYSQSLDRWERCKEPLADGLQFVVIKRQQFEIMQTLERVYPQAVDLIGIEKPENRGKVYNSLIL